MFSRSKAAPTARRAGRNSPSATDAALSIISADVRIGGDLAATGEVHLDGQIDGDIRCDALTLGEHSVVCGDILVDSLVAHGRISGQVVARTVRFGPTARLRGDVTYASLGIEAGAEIDGRFIHRNPADAAVPAAPAVAKLFAVDGD